MWPGLMHEVGNTNSALPQIRAKCKKMLFHTKYLLYHDNSFNASMIISTIWFTWAKLTSINSWTELLYSCDGHRRNTSSSNSQANTEALSERERETKGHCFESAKLLYRGLKLSNLTSGEIISYCQKKNT